MLVVIWHLIESRWSSWQDGKYTHRTIWQRVITLPKPESPVRSDDIVVQAIDSDRNSREEDGKAMRSTDRASAFRAASLYNTPPGPSNRRVAVINSSFCQKSTPAERPAWHLSNQQRWGRCRPIKPLGFLIAFPIARA